jgi:hypothetical protein
MSNLAKHSVSKPDTGFSIIPALISLIFSLGRLKLATL